LLINLHAMLGNQEEVGRLFEEVLVDFRDTDVLFQAGLYHFSRGHYPQAMSHLEEVVGRDPGDFEALTALGMVHERAGDPDAAHEHYTAALAVNPKHRQALIRLGALEERQGVSGAGGHFETAVENYPFDPEVNFNYGIFLVRTGETNRALEYLKRASALAEDALFEPAHFALASYFAQTGDPQTAGRYLREIILQTDDPNMLDRAQAMLEQLQ
jgi:type IV pilus assembly protein PilF